MNVCVQAALQSPQVRSVLEDMFLVRRVQTIAEVVALCAQAAGGALADDSALCKPVRR